MLRRLLLGTSLALVLVSTAAMADSLVLKGGKKIDTAGPWVTRGNIVTVHETSGRAQTLTLSIIDFDATLKANAHNPPTTADTVHVDTPTVLALQMAFKTQKEQAVRIREQEQANLLAQMTGAKPARVGAGPGGANAASQPFGTASSPGRGFDAVKNCAVFQDNVAAYNSCLKMYGH
jgi:hypothetical protein